MSYVEDADVHCRRRSGRREEGTQGGGVRKVVCSVGAVGLAQDECDPGDTMTADRGALGH